LAKVIITDILTPKIPNTQKLLPLTQTALQCFEIDRNYAKIKHNVMKNSFLVLSILILTCLGCNNSTINPNTDKGIMTCMIDGQVWSATVVDATNQNGELWIVASGDKAGISFVIDTKKIKVGTTIDLKPTPNNPYNVNLDCVVNEEAYDPVSGSIFISAISEKAIAGTFNFSAIETLKAKKTIKVTDGKFDAPIR
jgi:hypothetical protein